MRLVASVAFCLVLFVLPSSLSAAPIVIDFESLRHDDLFATEVGSVYIEDGFRFEARHPVPGNPELLRTLGTLHPGFAGSTSLSQGVSLGEIVLTNVTDTPFDLLSISFAEHPNLQPGGQFPSNGGPFDITVFGDRADGTTVTNVVHVANFLTLEPFFFSGFNDLTAVYWFQGAGATGGSPAHQFDNVTVTPVPEPASLALVGSGVVGLWLRFRVARRTSVRGRNTGLFAK